MAVKLQLVLNFFLKILSINKQLSISFLEICILFKQNLLNPKANCIGTG